MTMQVIRITDTAATKILIEGEAWISVLGSKHDIRRVRMMYDGTSPTKSRGFVLDIGAVVEFFEPTDNLQFISEDGDVYLSIQEKKTKRANRR